MVRQLCFLEEVDRGPDHGIWICNLLGGPSVHHKLDILLAGAWVAVSYPVYHLGAVPMLVYAHLAVEEEGLRFDGRRGGSDHRLVDDGSCRHSQSPRGHSSTALRPNYQHPFRQYLLSVLVEEQPFGL